MFKRNNIWPIGYFTCVDEGLPTYVARLADNE